MEVTKIFSFAGAHKLWDTRIDPEQNICRFGKCCSLHGHEWVLHVTVEGPINKDTGMVINFVDLKKIVTEKVIDVLDHSYINDKVAFLPTCENMLGWIHVQLKDAVPVKRLTLYETPTSYATLNCSLIREE